MLLVEYDCRDSLRVYTRCVPTLSVSFQRLLSPELFPKARSEVGPREK